MIPELTDNTILYHGSFCTVQLPDLQQCARYKDLGQGFYLTTSKDQAHNFAKMSVRKAIANESVNKNLKYGMISSFQLHSPEKLLIKSFPTADVDWLHCIVCHRKRDAFPELTQALKRFDVIAGKIANDNTNATITAYMSGVFGRSEERRVGKECRL